MTLMYALCIALAATLPWVVLARFIGAGVTFGISFVLALLVVYFGTPTIAGPLYGTMGFITLTTFLISGIILIFVAELPGEEKRAIPAIIGIIALALYGLFTVGNSTVFRAKDYAGLVPTIEAREWNADFQPKAPEHFRVSSPENAAFLAGRAMGQATTLDSNGQPNAIGSQFQVYDDVSSIQIIGHELWTIVPVDWNGLGPQFSITTGVPGYIKVSAENPIIPAEFVKLPAGGEFHYTPEAMWEKNLYRHVWYQHPDKYIADVHLEIDEEGKPHYIVSIAEPTIAWWGEKVIGAIIIDPVTGAGVEKIIPLNQVPLWVDRVEAEYIVHRNIDYHGKFSRGFFNRSIYGVSVLSATETHFGYGSNDQPIYATGITAHNSSIEGSPDSLVAVYYTNTRTGETVEYKQAGGTTESRAISQCNLLGPIRNQQYHGTTPQLYNVYGHLSYVVPIQNATHAFAGVCIVSVTNLQVIAWGPNAFSAELAYKQVINANSMQLAVEGARKLVEVVGKIERIGSMVVENSSIFFIKLEGIEHLFTIPITTSQKLPVTKAGDEVWVEYYDSNAEVMPANKFDNRSFALAASPVEINVRERRANEIDVSRANERGKADMDSILGKLTPADRALLEQRLKQ